MQPVSWNNGYDGASIDGNITLPNGKKGANDYYIRDYQENVRMILTEETHTSVNKGTMEVSRAANEEPIFGQPGAGNEVATTRFAISSIPGQSTGGGWQSNTSSSVSKLSKLSGHTIGPNSLLKVMAGDTLNASADYYYPSPVTNNSNSLVTDVVNNLVMAISGSAATSSTVKSGTSGISTNLNGSTPFANIADPNKTTTDNIPRAYLNIMFFDERFNFVSENSTAVRVSQPGDAAPPLVMPSNTKAPKNGYAYIYLSNENDQPVYFDNLQVSDKRGRLIEENHYYAFGLKIAGISSIKLPDANEGNINNKNLYNDKELIDEGDLNWYDYGFRNYDAQIGRFPQLDPLTDDYPHYTPFQYAGNEPIANVDMDGLEPWNVLQTVVVTGHATKTAASIGNGIAKGLSIASIGVSAAKIATTAISLRGTADAIKNSSSLGIYDIWGGNHVNEYKTTSEKQAYLQGRLNGDLLAILTGHSEMQVGGGIALTTGIETVGVGAVAGGVLSLYGAGTGGVATADMTKILKELYQLNMSANGGSDAASQNEQTGNYKEVKGNKAANEVAKEYGYRDAHELKRTHVGRGNEAKFDIYRDFKSNKLRLYDKSKKTSIDVYPNN